MKKTEEKNNIYQTGRTQPPKSHQGVIALLLILVILLSGAVSALSLMNISLFRQLEAQNSQSVRFSEDRARAAEEPDGVEAPLLGIKGQEFTHLYRSYQQWPQGIYISWVDPEGAGAALQVGDILVNLNGTSVTDGASFQAALSELTPGKAVTLTVFRNGEEMKLTLGSIH